MHFVDQVDLVTPLGWRVSNVFTELPDVFDTVVAGTINLDHVETVAGGNLAAVIAFAARCDRGSFYAIERLRQNSRGRCLSDAARADEEVRVSKPVLRDRVFQRARDMGLADQVVESLGPVFPGENLVTHALNLAKKLACESLRS